MATVLFFAPHQDDETLTMGAAISNHLNANHDVHVILSTDGINSGVRTKLGLSRTAFTKARDGEFTRACRALGVPADHIHISRFAAEDGKLTVARARDVISECVERFPGARVKTHTDRGMSFGQHPDHAHLGQAAVQLLNEGTVSDLRLYVEPHELTDFKNAYPNTAISTERTATPDAVQAAIQEYKRVDKANGMYGIGYLSVPSDFDMVEANPVSYYHVP